MDAALFAIASWETVSCETELSIVAASDTELVARENAIINDFVEKGIKQVLERKERVYRLATSTNR
ncbi:hypothetical protein THZB04_10735 [Vibrio owensii]|nr:hypothetical protein THZB04_10735 [Vibrio owensii]